MAILNTLIVSSAVAFSLLAQAATPVNALAAHGHLAARNAVSPNHNGMLKRKRNTHKLRKRCIAAQQQQASSSDTSPPATTQGTDDSGNNNNSGNTSNNNSGTPPPSSGSLLALAARTCYYYNWSSWAADSSLTGALKFVPMFWGGDHIDDFTDNVINSNTNYGVAMAMNEVNQSGQSDIDPGTGAAWWRQYLLPLRQNKGYYLVSPSTTSAPDGIPWMQQWIGQLGNDELPDALALHWYGWQLSDFESYVNTFSAAFPGYKLWITEFACTDFSGGNNWCDVPAFASAAASFLDNNPAVEAYFPFGFVGSMQGVQEENRLMNGDGSVTGVGWEYLQ